RSRTIHEEVDEPRGVALMNHNIGQALDEAGRYGEAISHLENARIQLAGIPEPYHEARALTALARVLVRAGRPPEAERPLEDALRILANMDAFYDQANAHVQMADLAETLGDRTRTRTHLERAYALFTAVGAAQAKEAYHRLDALDHPPEPAGGSPSR